MYYDCCEHCEHGEDEWDEEPCWCQEGPYADDEF